MKIDAGTILTNLSKTSAKAAPAKQDEVAATPGESFTRQPHADFDTNKAKLLAASRLPQAVKANYSEPISDQDVDQSGWQARLIDNLGPQFARMQYTHDCSKLQGMIPTQSQLQAEFDKLGSREDIPFEYIVDGCYARAHLMSEEMTKDGINNAKIFCMVEDPYGKGKLTAENKYMKAKWWYHVAPVVFAVDEKSKQVEPFVMDPSMAKTPLKPEQWIHAMWDENTKIKVDLVHDLQYGPLESDGPNATFQESIPSAHETCEEYSKELAQIKEDYNASHPGQGNRKAA
ncbi:hypothetical protein ABS71_16685 [bacterium SCN 62-11]|nr:hypothetical protein [Candidatus Eremiobacteraeota bacterium]ODT61800.1 MAG: hypothetical protein ABS71_16685 [bacterium SCN 62-11]